MDMEPLALYHINAVPGLYISDQPSARSEVLLKRHHISHVLSLRRWEDRYRTGTPELEATNILLGIAQSDQVRIKYNEVELEDDPTADILRSLNDALDWIRDALALPHPDPDLQGARELDPNGVLTRRLTDIMRVHTNRTRAWVEDRAEVGNEVYGGIYGDGQGQPEAEESPIIRAHAGDRVLVHCGKGISRSGAIVVAYIMRTLIRPYEQVLLLARASRPSIAPNIGFEYQLRIWAHDGYNVFFWSENHSLWVSKGLYQGFRDDISGIFDRADEEGIVQAREEWLRSLEVTIPLFDEC
ncbi:protein-tyrosine phosphatase-like protein [Aspergillus oleicola]